MPRTTRRTNAQRSAETKGRLLSATIDCLVERGYPGTSTTEICRRAGLSRGAQLHHYPTKAKLVVAAVEHLFARRHEEIRSVIDVEGTPGERMDSAFRKLWEVYSGPTLGAWMELAIASRTDLVLREAARQLNERFVAEVEVTFRRFFDLPPEAPVESAARLMLAVFDGLAMNHIVEDDHALAGRVLGVFRELIEPWTRGELGDGR